MNDHFSRGVVRGLVVCLINAGLAACAVSSPAAITEAQSAPEAVTNLQFVSDDYAKSGLRAQLKTALTTALTAKGVGLGEGADYLADFTVAERPADLALQNVTDDDANASPPSSDFTSHWLHKCKAHRVSASLVIYAKESGAMHSRSEGEYLTCPGDTSQLETLAELLATRALQN